MKKTGTLFAFLLASFIVRAQSDLEVDYNSVKGSVKQIRLVEMSFSEKNGNTVTSPRIITFNKAGKVEKISSVKAGKKTYEETYFYDTSGNVAKLHAVAGDQKLTRSYLYKAGQLVEIIYIVDGKESLRRVFINNAIDKPDNEIQYKEGNINGKYKYYYDVNGNKIEKVEYKADGALVSKTKFSYDKNNNPVEITYFDSNGKATGTVRCVYEFDKNNNWTKRSISRNGVPEAENYVEITYR